MVLAIAGILTNLFNLQIANHKYYETLAEGNRFKFTPTLPPRGLIYDRNHQPLAINKTVYNLELNPQAIDNLQHSLAIIGESVALDQKTIAKVNQEYTNKSAKNITLRSHLTESEVAHISVDMHHLNGVEINGQILRYYPDRELFSHLIGYVAPFSASDIQKDNHYDYFNQRYIGKTGVEKFYEKSLRGKIGFKKIEVNAHGRLVRTIVKYNAQPGTDFLLTVDKNLQKVAYDALGEYSGAAVLLDTRNGDVLALVSRPTFDANLFSYAFSEKTYKALQSDPRKPFFNRSLSGQYPPGSTIKPMVALAGLESNTVTQDYLMYAGPYYQIPGNNHQYSDWKKSGHGWIDLSNSITQSCDVFFYNLAYEMGINKMSSSIKRFGLGEKTGIDLAFESTGLIPNPEWKQKKLDQSWLPGETVLSGIGQGYMLATPLQMAVATSVIANRGKRVVPRIVKAVHNQEKWIYRPVKWKTRVIATEKNWNYVVNAMKNVVHKSNGTAYGISHNLDYNIAGKTGTMQLASLSNINEDESNSSKHLIDHGMFIAFAPVDNPQIAIAVLAEHSGSGTVAASIARKILDAYFKKASVATSDDN